MNTIETLRTFGIDYLTGEACGIALRLLFDLTENGERIIDSFFGGVQTTSKAWNKGKSSIMLPRSILDDLCVYALLTEYEYVVVKPGQGPVGLDKTRYNRYFALSEQCPEYFGSLRFYRKNKSHPGTGLENTHQMSGRTQGE